MEPLSTKLETGTKPEPTKRSLISQILLHPYLKNGRKYVQGTTVLPKEFSSLDLKVLRKSESQECSLVHKKACYQG